MKNDYESLTHTKWRCQYHIVLTPKYRRQIIYGKYKAEIGKILRTICERYEVEIIEEDKKINTLELKYDDIKYCPDYQFKEQILSYCDNLQYKINEIIDEVNKLKEKYQNNK